jgi:hypothetical protein
LSSFLRYVVNETLEGRADRIKERTVAVNALERGNDYDSRHDPVVRIVAGKLRQALTRYYAEEGSDSPVRISIPKGQYWPVFSVPVSSVAEPIPEDQATEVTQSEVVTSAPEIAKDFRSQAVRYGNLTVRALGSLLLIGGCVWLLMPEGDSPQPPMAVANAWAPADPIRQFGALPYRLREGKLELLLVRTLRDSHWTIPKATHKEEVSPEVTVASESLKEAGVRGHVASEPIGVYFYDRKGNWYAVSVIPVLVEDELDTWPEHSRRREWVSQRTAQKMVGSGELGSIISNFTPSEPER